MWGRRLSSEAAIHVVNVVLLTRLCLDCAVRSLLGSLSLHIKLAYLQFIINLTSAVLQFQLL